MYKKERVGIEHIGNRVKQVQRPEEHIFYLSCTRTLSGRESRLQQQLAVAGGRRARYVRESSQLVNLESRDRRICYGCALP